MTVVAELCWLLVWTRKTTLVGYQGLKVTRRWKFTLQYCFGSWQRLPQRPSHAHRCPSEWDHCCQVTRGQTSHPEPARTPKEWVWQWKLYPFLDSCLQVFEQFERGTSYWNLRLMSRACVVLDLRHTDMEFLEVLTEGLERVLMVRGGGREVITIYSWVISCCSTPPKVTQRWGVGAVDPQLHPRPGHRKPENWGATSLCKGRKCYCKYRKPCVVIKCAKHVFWGICMLPFPLFL